MRLKQHNSDSLPLVVVLLATAVILPTVCLLWFMTQAVKNERLAVRQKLLDICREDADGIKTNLIQSVAAQTQAYRQSAQQSEQDSLALWIAALPHHLADGVVIYDRDAWRVFPPYADEPGFAVSPAIPAALALEHRGDYPQALEAYGRLADPEQPAEVRFAALTGRLRCLEKTGQIVEARALLDKALWADERAPPNTLTPARIAMLRVYEVELLTKHFPVVEQMLPDGTPFAGTLDGWYTPRELYPSETTIWALTRVLQIAAEVSEQFDVSDRMKQAEHIIMSETRTLAAANCFDEYPAFKDRPDGRWFAIPTEPALFVLPVDIDSHRFFYLMTQENWLRWFEPVLSDAPIPGTRTVAYDDRGRLVYGTPPEQGEPFVTTTLDDFSPGWSLALYFDSDDPFSVAAERQAAIYMWTGVLVVVLMLLAGVAAIRTVGRQIRLNALKNDFIATVTHELKTPLSSMRLLVETLLDGGYTDTPRCREYLEMIGRENCRLSRMIDSFLTFSRMERGKQVFDMERTDPAEIAEAAAEAVQAKFQEKKCGFSVITDAPLPSIMADKDAMVTVLVNLLDNACKYSGDDKDITLHTAERDGRVCFSVSDNGLGMTRRQSRRIFDKFYQADNALARRAEGCGLGLSIVKYILDAHKATITVDSKPGKGSVFTVSVPGV